MQLFYFQMIAEKLLRNMFFSYLTSETKSFIMIVKPGHTELFKWFESIFSYLIFVVDCYQRLSAVFPYIQSVYHVSSKSKCFIMCLAIIVGSMLL